MSNIEDIVDSLENKISKILHKQELLKQANLKLKVQLEDSQKELQEQNLTISSWKDKYEALKFANTMLGSDDNKRETKLKINALIREIDHCIAQLSD
jgi:chromosome segregation ATPase